jgi:predicted DNA binding CopG/RHH family protein
MKAVCASRFQIRTLPTVDDLLKSLVIVIMKKPIPKFKSEDAEREFWATHDSTDYIDWRKGKRVTLPNLKPSSQTISLRLPKPMLDRLKLLAHKRDVPYQSLLKMFVAERLKAEFESSETDGARR